MQIKLKYAPLYILLSVGCLRWFFEGVIGGYTWQCIFLSLGLLIVIFTNRITISHMNFEWILFLAGILVSMVLGAGTISNLQRFLYVALIVLFAVFCNYKPGNCKGCIKLIITAGVVYAIFIILQFIMRSNFNDILFSFLRPTSLSFAQQYYQSGHFYGIFFTPADPAGLLVFTISFLILGNIMSSRINSTGLTQRDTLIQMDKLSSWVLAILLLVPLLLTGKRGVLFCGVASVMIVLLIYYGNRRQWYRVIGIIAIVIIAILVFIYLVTVFPDNPILQRFSSFFNSLSEGDIDDSGRERLYSIALDLWSNNKLFGIGWRNFSQMTVSSYGYNYTHEVNCEYLQFLCETGIIGTILIMIPILMSFRRAIIVCRYYEQHEGISSDEKRVVLCAVFIQFFTLIYAWVETPFNDMMFFIIYIFSVIVINGCYKQMDHLKQKHGKHLKLRFERR